MPQYRVGLTCSNPEVLPYLSTYLQEPWCTIIEDNGGYYWRSSHFEVLATVAEVDARVDKLLPRLNGLVKLHLLNASEIAKAGVIGFIDDQGQYHEYRRFTTSALVTYKITEDNNLMLEIRRKWLNLVEKCLEEGEDSPIHLALSYHSKEANWHNLYDVYEVIKQDYNHLQGITNTRQYVLLPDDWTRDATGRNREKDFTESANNAYISGSMARHSLATSDKVQEVAHSSLVKVIRPSGREELILPMPLNRATTFITGLLTQWLTKRRTTATADSH